MTTLALAMLVLMSPLWAAAQDTVYDPGPGITLPKVITEVKPDYPREAMNSGIQGSVRLRCVVALDGRAAEIAVTQPLDPRLDEAAAAALREWEFEPGRKDDKAVPVRVEIEIRFALK